MPITTTFSELIRKVTRNEYQSHTLKIEPEYTPQQLEQVFHALFKNTVIKVVDLSSCKNLDECKPEFFALVKDCLQENKNIIGIEFPQRSYHRSAEEEAAIQRICILNKWLLYRDRDNSLHKTTIMKSANSNKGKVYWLACDYRITSNYSVQGLQLDNNGLYFSPNSKDSALVELVCERIRNNRTGLILNINHDVAGVNGENIIAALKQNTSIHYIRYNQQRTPGNVKQLLERIAFRNRQKHAGVDGELAGNFESVCALVAKDAYGCSELIVAGSAYTDEEVTMLLVALRENKSIRKLDLRVCGSTADDSAASAASAVTPAIYAAAKECLQLKPTLIEINFPRHLHQPDDAMHQSIDWLMALNRWKTAPNPGVVGYNRGLSAMIKGPEIVDLGDNLLKVKFVPSEATNEKFAIFCQRVKDNLTGKWLDFTTSHFTQDMAEALQAAMKENTTIHDVTFAHAKISKAIQSNISDKVTENFQLSYFLKSFYLKQGPDVAMSRLLPQFPQRAVSVAAGSMVQERLCDALISRIVQSIAESTKISKVDIDGIQIRDRIQLLYPLFNNNNIKILRFSSFDAYFSENEIFQLAKGLEQYPNHQIHALSFESIELSESAVKQIIAILQSTANISRLELKNCKLNDNAICMLAEFVKTNTTVIHLDISENVFTGVGLTALGQALQQNRTLVSLEIYRNNNEDGEIDQFLTNIRLNKALRVLGLSHRTHGQYTGHAGGRSYEKTTNKTYLAQLRQKISKFTVSNANKSDEAVLAARQGKLEDLQHKIEQGVSLYTCDSAGDTLMYHAVNGSHIKIIRYLLLAGFNIHVMNNARVTVLECVQSATNSAELLSVLTAPVAPIEAAAAAAGSKKRKADPKQPSILNMFAARAALAATAFADDTLETGIAAAPPSKKARTVGPVSEESSQFSQALTVQEIAVFHAAIVNESIDAVSEQVAQGIDVNVVNAYGQTGVHLAAKVGRSKILQELLIVHGADATRVDLAGRTALHLACMQPVEQEVVKQLLQANVPVNAVDQPGLPALFYLAGGYEQRDISVSEDQLRAAMAFECIKAGANPSLIVYDYEGGQERTTALHKVIQRGWYHTFKVMLKSPLCDVNVKDANHATPLHWAIRYERLDIIAKLLLVPGIRLDIADCQGQTALQLLPVNANLTVNQVRIQAMLTDRMRRNVPAPISGVRWAQSMSFFYGCRDGANKSVTVDCADALASLRAAVEAKRGARGNLVVATLMFVVSDQAHQPNGEHRRITIKVPLTFQAKIHSIESWVQRETVTQADPVSGYPLRRERSPDARDRIINRLNSAPAESRQACTDDLKQAILPLSEKAIRKLYEVVKPTAPAMAFEQRFHHSEQALLDHLQQTETSRHIAEKLAQHDLVAAGAKVYATQLLLYTERYLCPDCEISILGAQNPQSEFLVGLVTALQAAGLVVPQKSPLIMTTFVATKMPYPMGAAKKTPADHQVYHVDLRQRNTGLILAQDVESVHSAETIYTSSRT